MKKSGLFPKIRKTCPHPISTVFLLLFSIMSGILLFSCQTFPDGESIEEVSEESDISIKDLYTYIVMCMSVWKEYEQFRETDWELDYFSHDATNTLAVSIPKLEEADTPYMAFRGTQSKCIDVRLNMKFFRKSIPFADERRMKAHRGFVQRYMGIREDLHKRVEKYNPGKIVLTGHSGGGALASLAFLDLKSTYSDIELQAVVFGIPRVFNRYAATWFEPHEEDFIRIVMGRDAIPNLPPALFGYRHIGRLVRIGRRPIFPFISFKAHWPGYRDELKKLFLEAGFEPQDYGFE